MQEADSARHSRPVDPDPLVVGVLTKLVSEMVWGALKRGYRALMQRPSGSEVAGLLHGDHLTAWLDRLDKLVAQAEQLVGSRTGLERGGMLLLHRQQLDEYFDLRDRLMSMVREIDDHAVRTSAQQPTPTRRGGPRRLPADVLGYVRVIERNLDEASTAATAGVQFLAIRQAILGMREVLRVSGH